MFSAILTDPFGTSHAETLAAAIEGLREVVLVCWPRLSEPIWRDEILRMIIVCWLNVLEHEQGQKGVPAGKRSQNRAPDVENLKKQLSISTKQLLSVWEADDVDVVAKIKLLTAKEPRLVDLFARD